MLDKFSNKLCLFTINEKISSVLNSHPLGFELIIFILALKGKVSRNGKVA